MLKYFKAFFIIIILVCSANKCDKERKDYIPGEVIIKYLPETDSATIDSLCIAIGLEELKRIPQINAIHYKISSDISVEDIIRNYQKNPNIESIEPNYRISIDK